MNKEKERGGYGMNFLPGSDDEIPKWIEKQHDDE